MRSEHRLVVVKGMDDLMVIETADAILIAKKEDSQGLKLMETILILMIFLTLIKKLNMTSQ